MERGGLSGSGAVARADNATVARWLDAYVQLRGRSKRKEDEIGIRISATEKGSIGSGTDQNDLKAQIAHHYTPLVEAVARRFNASGEPFEDLVQEGFLGLLSALEHYDPGKGVKFSTYATHFVAGAIRHCLRDRGKIIKEPAWLHDLAGKINRTADSLHQTLGRTAHAAEIAQALNLKEEAVEEILSTRQVFHVVAFDTPVDDDDGGMIGLVDPEKIRSDRYVTLQLPIEDRIVLEEAAQKLKALEQKVLFEFFYKDHNQTEIAKKLGISCNYVSHILKNSTKKLRKIMGEAEIRDRGRAPESSVIDSASGLYTSAYLLGRLEEELSRAARTNQPTAVLLVTIDGLSTAPGSSVRHDEVWRVCGETVRRSLRRMDIAGRHGEEGLLIVFPQTGTQALLVAERLTDVLLAAGAASHTPFTVRTGIALGPEHGRTSRELLSAARACLGLSLTTLSTFSIATSGVAQAVVA